MLRMLSGAAALSSLLWCGEAAAQRLNIGGKQPTMVSGKHCYGSTESKLVLEHFMAGSINPLGIGNSLRLGWCEPLIKKPGLLFDYTNIDVGILLTNSPTDVQVGLSTFVSPLSILVLRAEVAAFYIWPIPLQGAGLIKVNSPADFQLDLLKPDPAGPNAASTAFGGRALLGATLQGQVPLGKKLSLLASLGASGEYWHMSSPALTNIVPGGGFFSARRDVILLGRGDWVVASTAALALGITVHRNAILRVGATNDLVYVPSHGYLGNIAAGILAVSVPNLRELAKNLSVFLRVGTFTHHAFRTGLTLAAGLSVQYELLPKPRPHRAPITDGAETSGNPGGEALSPPPGAGPSPTDQPSTSQGK